MSESPKKFAKLLTLAIRRIKQKEKKQINIIQDDLGHVVGKGSMIEYWRKGKDVPSDLLDSLKLAESLVDRGGLTNRGELKEFLLSAGHPNPEGECNRLFPSPPLDRPHRVETFVGREAELKQLIKNLQPGRIVALIGPGGVGKTALTSTAIWTLAPGDTPPDCFPDGIFFHNFYTERRVLIALENIVQAFGEKPIPNLSAAARRALASQRALLVLDGVESADDLQAVLAIRGNCCVLLTSRSRKDLSIADYGQEIGPLPLDQAIELFKIRGGSFAVDDDIIRQICKRVEGLPLAVILIGSFLTESKQNADEYLEWLEASPYEALDFTGERQHENIWKLLKKSLDQVSEAARQAMALTGLLSLAPFDREAISAAMELPAASVGPQILGELVGYSLLERTGQRYVVIHALVHTYIQQELKAPQVAIKRLTDYFVELASEQSKQEQPGYARLNLERPHLLAVLDGCSHRQDWDAAKTLATTIDNYLAIQGHWTDRVATTKLGIIATNALGDQRGKGAFLRKLGVAYRHQGNREEAIDSFQKAMHILTELGDRLGECLTALDMGNLYNQLANWSQAIELYQTALTGFHDLTQPALAAATLSNMAIAYRRQGQLDTARERLEEGLEIMRQIDNRPGEVRTFHNIGMIYLEQERWNEAEQVFLKTMKGFQDIGDRDAEAQAACGLGAVYENLKRQSEAIEMFNHGLTIFEEIGNRYGIGHASSGLGNVYYSLQNWDEAGNLFLKSLAVLEEIEDPQGQSLTLKTLGDVYRQQERWDEALDMYQQARDLSHNLGQNHQEGVTLMAMGRLYEMNGDGQKAVSLWDEAKARLRKDSSEYQQVSEWLQSKK